MSINQGLTEDFGSVYTVKNVPSTKYLNNYLNQVNPCGQIRMKQVRDKDFPSKATKSILIYSLCSQRSSSRALLVHYPT